MIASLAPLIRKTGFRYGIMLGLVSAALFFTFVLLKLKTNDWMLALPGITLTSVFIFLAHLFFKENSDGTMTFGQGVSISFWIGLVSGVLNSVISYIYMKFVNTQFVASMMEVARGDMEKNGMSDDQIDMALSMTKILMTPEVMLFTGIFGAIIGALIVGLIVSIFTKKNPAVATF